MAAKKKTPQRRKRPAKKKAGKRPAKKKAGKRPAKRKAGKRPAKKQARKPAADKKTAAVPADEGFVILLDGPEPAVDEAKVPDDAGFVILLDGDESVATSTTLSLPVDCERDQLGGLKAQFVNAIGDGQDIEIDAAAVKSIDTATMQLLLAVACTARAKGVGVRWPSSSDVFESAATSLGLAAEIGCG